MTHPVTSRWVRTLARVYALGAAALFPTSLIAGVWLYLSLGSPSAAPSPFFVAASVSGSVSPAAAVLVNVLLFGLFALHHSLLARTHAKAWLTRLIPASLERSTYVLIASVLFLLVVAAWQPVPGLWYRVEGWPAWLLRGVQAAGIGLTLLAAKAIDPFELAGLRQAFAGDANPPVSTNDSGAEDIFTSTGLYGVVRHPIYFAWMLMVWPTPVMTSGRLTFAAVTSAYLVLAIPWEERALIARHGAFYQRYRDRVRWRVLPGIY
jgi:protein-S-isoprenylcysteine O-methyltransferase Ste14